LVRTGQIHCDPALHEAQIELHQFSKNSSLYQKLIDIKHRFLEDLQQFICSAINLQQDICICNK
jgi:hypothetical protein